MACPMSRGSGSNYIGDMSALQGPAECPTRRSEVPSDDSLGEAFREVDVTVAGDDGGLFVAGGDRAQQVGMHACDLAQVVELLVMHEIEAAREGVQGRDRLFRE